MSFKKSLMTVQTVQLICRSDCDIWVLDERCNCSLQGSLKLCTTLLAISCPPFLSTSVLINGSSTLAMVSMESLNSMVTCTVDGIICVLDEQSCVDGKMNSTARVGLVGWHCCHRGKEVAGLWEMPRTILKREDDMFEEMDRTYFSLWMKNGDLVRPYLQSWTGFDLLIISRVKF